jgi:hypothetical protein
MSAWVPGAGPAWLAAVAALLFASCSGPPFTLTTDGPWSYRADVDPAVERVAVLVTITNLSGDDLAVNPADFQARDADRRLYPASPKGMETDAHAVRRAYANLGGSQSILPLPTVTLRQDDVLTGFVVFDVPFGVRPSELIWRQVDYDTLVPLGPPPSRG